MRHQSLSSFVRNATDQHFEGPIPASERERIRTIESAERAMERDMAPIELAMRSLRIAVGDLDNDTLHIEALRQLTVEATDHNAADNYAKQHARHVALALESARWTQQKLTEVLALLQPAEQKDAA